MMKLNPGTRIELSGCPAMGGFAAVLPEAAVIVRWSEKVSGPRDAVPGYHAVKFSNGGELLVHETRFRVIDNR